MKYIYIYIYICIYIYMYIHISLYHISLYHKSLDVVQSLYFGSLLPKYRDCTTSNDFESYIYIYIYIKFTEASHHNTLNMTQNRWM